HATARPPAATISEAVRWAPASSMSHTPMPTPSRASRLHVARPIPEAPPVTIAFFPAIDLVSAFAVGGSGHAKEAAATSQQCCLSAAVGGAPGVLSPDASAQPSFPPQLQDPPAREAWPAAHNHPESAGYPQCGQPRDARGPGGRLQFRLAR